MVLTSNIRHLYTSPYFVHSSVISGCNSSSTSPGPTMFWLYIDYFLCNTRDTNTCKSITLVGFFNISVSVCAFFFSCSACCSRNILMFNTTFSNHGFTPLSSNVDYFSTALAGFFNCQCCTNTLRCFTKACRKQNTSLPVAKTHLTVNYNLALLSSHIWT